MSIVARLQNMISDPPDRSPNPAEQRHVGLAGGEQIRERAEREPRPSGTETDLDKQLPREGWRHEAAIKVAALEEELRRRGNERTADLLAESVRTLVTRADGLAERPTDNQRTLESLKDLSQRFGEDFAERAFQMYGNEQAGYVLDAVAKAIPTNVSNMTPEELTQLGLLVEYASLTLMSDEEAQQRWQAIGAPAPNDHEGLRNAIDEAFSTVPDALRQAITEIAENREVPFEAWLRQKGITDVRTPAIASLIPGRDLNEAQRHATEQEARDAAATASKLLDYAEEALEPRLATLVTQIEPLTTDHPEAHLSATRNVESEVLDKALAILRPPPHSSERDIQEARETLKARTRRDPDAVLRDEFGRSFSMPETACYSRKERVFIREEVNGRMCSGKVDIEVGRGAIMEYVYLGEHVSGRVDRQGLKVVKQPVYTFRFDSFEDVMEFRQQIQNVVVINGRSMMIVHDRDGNPSVIPITAAERDRMLQQVEKTYRSYIDGYQKFYKKNGRNMSKEEVEELLVQRAQKSIDEKRTRQKFKEFGPTQESWVEYGIEGARVEKMYDERITNLRKLALEAQQAGRPELEQRYRLLAYRYEQSNGKQSLHEMYSGFMLTFGHHSKYERIARLRGVNAEQIKYEYNMRAELMSDYYAAVEDLRIQLEEAYGSPELAATIPELERRMDRLLLNAEHAIEQRLLQRMLEHTRVVVGGQVVGPLSSTEAQSFVATRMRALDRSGETYQDALYTVHRAIERVDNSAEQARNSLESLRSLDGRISSFARTIDSHSREEREMSIEAGRRARNMIASELSTITHMLERQFPDGTLPGPAVDQLDRLFAGNERLLSFIESVPQLRDLTAEYVLATVEKRDTNEIVRRIQERFQREVSEATHNATRESLRQGKRFSAYLGELGDLGQFIGSLADAERVREAEAALIRTRNEIASLGNQETPPASLLPETQRQTWSAYVSRVINVDGYFTNPDYTSSIKDELTRPDSEVNLDAVVEAGRTEVTRLVQQLHTRLDGSEPMPLGAPANVREIVDLLSIIGRDSLSNEERRVLISNGFANNLLATRPEGYTPEVFQALRAL